jgi:hypothetical protein
MRHCHDAATFIQKFVRKLLCRVSLDKPGRDIVRKHQKEINALLKTKDSRSETEQIARIAAAVGKTKVDMEKQRNRNVDMRRALSFNLRSKHTRKQDREKMMKHIGKLQPPRTTVYEPLVFAIARQQPDRLPPRIGHIRSKVLRLVRNSNSLLDKSLPVPLSRNETRGAWVCPFRPNDPQTGLAGNICQQVNPQTMRNCAACKKRNPDVPHASTLRGRAAVIAMRMAKTPKMPDSKTPLLNVELCGKWGAGLLQPKGF